MVSAVLVILVTSTLGPMGAGGDRPLTLGSESSGSHSRGGGVRPSSPGRLPVDGSPPWNPEYSLYPANRELLPGAQPLPSLGEPQYGAYDPLDQRVYVASTGRSSSGLEILDPSTLRQVGTLGSVPYSTGLTVESSTGDLIVASDGNVSVVNPLNGTVVERVAAPDAGSTGNGVFAWDPRENVLVVSNEISGDANVVNLTLGRVVANLSLGYDSTDAMFDPGTGRLYVAGFENQAVEVFDSSTWADILNVSIPGGAGLYGVAVDPANDMLYVTSTSCCIVDTAILTKVALSNDTIVGSTHLGSYPTGMVYDSDLNALVVADPEVDALEVVDPTTLATMAVVPLPPTPSALVTAWWIVDVPALHAVFVPGASQDFVALVSTTNLTTVAFWDGWAELTRVGTDPACGCLAISDQWRQRVYLVNDTTWTVVAQVEVHGAPTGFAFDPRSGDLWVTLGGAFGSRGILILNGSTGDVVGTAAANYPASIAWDPSSGQMLVTESFQSDVLVLNGSNGSVVRHVGVGSQPEGIVVDSDLNTVFVADSGGDNLTALDATSDRVTGSIPVPAGPEWLAYAPAEHRLYVTNYTEVTWLDPATLTFGGSLPISFTTGAVVGPDGSTVALVNESAEFTIINGSSGAATTVPIGYEIASVGWSNSSTIAAADWLGTLYVLGAGTGPILSNASLAVAPSVVPVGGTLTISAHVGGGSGSLSYRYWGLPAGCGAVVGAGGNCTPTEAGTYEISVTIRDSTGDALTAAATVWAIPATASFPVEVRERGLPNGTPWWFSIVGGPNSSSTSPFLLTELANGSFAYVAGTVAPGWIRAAGTVEVAGGHADVNVSFREPEYEVTFAQQGLAAGVVWSVVFPNGTSFSSPFSTVNFTLPNGSFAYRIVGPADQPATPSSGVLNVSGASVEVNVSFAAILSVTLSGDPLFLSVNATVTITAAVHGGSPPFTFAYDGLPPGCTAANLSVLTCRPTENGSFQIGVIVSDPLGVAASANFTLIVSNLPSSGNAAGGAGSGWVPWLVFGAVAAVAAAGLLVALRRRRVPPPPSSGVSPPK